MTERPRATDPLPRTVEDLLAEEAAKRLLPPPSIRCPKCGAEAVAFICDERGCPVNGGAAYG